MKLRISLLACCITLAMPVSGMHISEGFLPAQWCALWYLVAAPFVIIGFYSIRKNLRNNPRLKVILGISGAFMFVLSALKLPSVTGSCSHLTGTGLGALIFGPMAMSVLGVIVLLFQALLLAHGGITTLGANVFSMAIAGPILVWVVFLVLRKLKVNESVSVFFAAFTGDIFTYMVTSAQLALAFPDSLGGMVTSLAKFMSLFAFTQLPLAMVEGIITVFVYNLVKKYASAFLYHPSTEPYEPK